MLGAILSEQEAEQGLDDLDILSARGGSFDLDSERGSGISVGRFPSVVSEEEPSTLEDANNNQQGDLTSSTSTSSRPLGIAKIKAALEKFGRLSFPRVWQNLARKVAHDSGQSKIMKGQQHRKHQKDRRGGGLDAGDKSCTSDHNEVDETASEKNTGTTTRTKRSRKDRPSRNYSVRSDISSAASHFSASDEGKKKNNSYGDINNSCRFPDFAPNSDSVSSGDDSVKIRARREAAERRQKQKRERRERDQLREQQLASAGLDVQALKRAASSSNGVLGGEPAGGAAPATKKQKVAATSEKKSGRDSKQKNVADGGITDDGQHQEEAKLEPPAEAGLPGGKRGATGRDQHVDNIYHEVKPPQRPDPVFFRESYARLFYRQNALQEEIPQSVDCPKDFTSFEAFWYRVTIRDELGQLSHGPKRFCLDDVFVDLLLLQLSRLQNPKAPVPDILAQFAAKRVPTNLLKVPHPPSSSS
ncbi:unnamed protein product, partial [Amoebophrya sp. A120]|eukprot:GSA120T00020078001.1